MRPRPAVLLAVLPWLATSVSAQLPDIQPGRNYPASTDAFGSGRSENVDVGDVDRDGDLDAVVANGGDGGDQDNRIYINAGGAQAGTAGTFLDETAVRFAGVPADTSRDVELVDVDDDGDLDVYVTNRGTLVSGGQAQRHYRNQGGLQGGAIGYFLEETDAFWGTLLSVDPSREIGVQDGQGPWKTHTADADFADLDDDGDLDLFQSSAGVNFNGTEESRIFLNDGTGRFDELWPWADAAADIQLHCVDADLADFDSDYDIDIFASSRDSQSRVYRNNLYGETGGGEPFTDMTQSALLDTGAGVNGSNTYEVEYADIDGDGDFDAWVVNYDGGGGGNLDRLLENAGGFTFVERPGWIKGDPNIDENEVDFVDFDSDGDLDVLLANFLGTNWIYQSGLAEGIPPALGYYHRTGTTSGGSQAPHDETPASGNGGTTLDGEIGDMDGDGDPDILLANDLNQQNDYWENVLGVPDTHAPAFHQVTVQADKSDGSDTPIHAQVRDNAPHYLIAYHDVRLFYAVDGGTETCVVMRPQGSQQFRGVIPGGLDGTIAYRVEATDAAGNTGVSATTAYRQSSATTSPWITLDCGTEGVAGRPVLEGSGDLSAASTTTLNLTRAAPDALAMLFLSLASTPTPFKGGLLYTVPIDVMLSLLTDAGGQVLLQSPWPAGVPAGTTVYSQYGIVDATNPSGATLSNAVLATTP